MSVEARVCETVRANLDCDGSSASAECVREAAVSAEVHALDEPPIEAAIPGHVALRGSAGRSNRLAGEVSGAREGSWVNGESGTAVALPDRWPPVRLLLKAGGGGMVGRSRSIASIEGPGGWREGGVSLLVEAVEEAGAEGGAETVAGAKGGATGLAWSERSTAVDTAKLYELPIPRSWRQQPSSSAFHGTVLYGCWVSLFDDDAT